MRCRGKAVETAKKSAFKRSGVERSVDFRAVRESTAGYRLCKRRKDWGLRGMCLRVEGGGAGLLLWDVSVKSLRSEDGEEHNRLRFQLREYYIELLVSGHCVAMK